MNIILSLSLVTGGLLLGIIFEKLILNKLKKIAAQTKWEGDDIVINSLAGWIIFWFVLAGIYLMMYNLPLKSDILNHLQKILIILYVISATIVLAKIAVGFVNLYMKNIREALPSVTIFTNLTKLIVFLIGVLIILNSLGISITPILTALGVGGLAVALALQDTITNLFSGLHIIATRQIKPGDYIKLDTGEEGYAVDITWRNTVIRELPNNQIIVPNSKIANAIVKNYHMPEKDMAVIVQVGVSYDSDLHKVERVTIEVAKEVMKEVTGCIPEFEPFIRYHTFGDFSINFSVIMRAKEFVDQYLIKHEFIKRLHKRYNEEKIVIPFPIRTVYMQR